MPLITCKDCKKAFSDAAKSCPNCGRPSKSPSLFTKDIGVVGLVYTLLLGFGGLASLSEAWRIPGITVAIIALLLLIIRLKSWSAVHVK
jgi:hypothetical protein